ncbi:MAG: hypothetical protein AAGF11_06240 [Myxococcota bacterium]
MLKIASIALATLFSTGLSLNVEEIQPSDPTQEDLTSEDPSEPVPASLNSCIQECYDDWDDCEASCTTPMCYFQCELAAQECYNNCYISN